MLDFVNVKSTKKTVISLVVGMLMVLAMMPGMAFADTVAVTIDEPTTEIVVGTPYTMTSPQSDYEGAHIDWSITSGGDIATISKHKAQLVATAAGTVTVKATLVTGEATSGSGGGNGTGGNTQCEGTVLGTATKEITVVASSSYGFQGLSGNTLKMLSPSSISVGRPATSTAADGKTVYNNSISGKVALTNKTAVFGYTMSAGVNNFKESTFNFYKDDIKILTTNHEAVSDAEISYNDFVTADKMVKINASGLNPGQTYILQFGPTVCGNNKDKCLGCYVEFTFTTE